MRQKAFGEAVTARDVERLPEDLGPLHFVRACGALIRWALVEHGSASAHLQIAERLTVPDRGADAECTLSPTAIETGGLVGPGRTIFQFKYRDVGATNRSAIVSALGARLRAELGRLPADCNRYVLMTNVSLAGTQPTRLRKAIASGAPARSTNPIIVWGAAEIANTLNASPGLRHLFFAVGEERYEVHLGPGARQALQVASLLPLLGVAERAAADVAAVSKALDLDPGVFTAHRFELERIGLLRRRGRFVEVVPPVLAEHLAAQALTNAERVIAELRLSLSAGRFLAFLHRLSKLRREGVRSAIERLLEEWCAGFDGLRRNSEVIHTLAPAVPQAAVRCIEDGLRGVSAPTLVETLKGEERRALVWALEDLVFRAETFKRGAGQLLGLAEAENETSANNATGVFVSLFHWRHPEIPVSLSQRLDVLTEGAASGSPARRRLAAAAAGATFKEPEVSRSHHPTGPDPPEPRYRPDTWEDVGRYGLGVLEVLHSLQTDTDAEVRTAAATAVMDVFRPLILVSLRLPESSETALELTRTAFAALARVAHGAENARIGEAVATRLELLAESMIAVGVQRPAIAQEVMRTAKGLEADLTKSFQGRLWRVIGPASWEQRRRWRNGAAERKKAIDEVATEILQDPRYPALLEAHLAWLTGEEARSGSELFRALGARDARRRGLASLITAPLSPFGEQRFSAYMIGWSTCDAEGARGELDRLIASRPDLAGPLLRAVAAFCRGGDLVKRARHILATGSLARLDFAARLASLLAWDELSAIETEELLTLADDGTPEVRGALLTVYTAVDRGVQGDHRQSRRGEGLRGPVLRAPGDHLPPH